MELYRKIIQATPAGKDQDHLRVIIDSNPKIPDRTPAIVAAGESPVPAMAESGSVLTAAGADVIIIPCISAHFFLDELQSQLNIPILSAFDAVGEHIQRRHPDVRQVGLLATSGTVQGGRFAARLADYGIGVIVADKRTQVTVMQAIYHIKGSQEAAFRAEAKSLLISVAEHIIARGAGGIIAGCTEIPLELEPRDIQVPLFDPLRILAQAAVNNALNQ